MSSQCRFLYGFQKSLFTTNLAANFGCYHFRIMAEIISMLLHATIWKDWNLSCCCWVALFLRQDPLYWQKASLLHWGESTELLSKANRLREIVYHSKNWSSLGVGKSGSHACCSGTFCCPTTLATTLPETIIYPWWAEKDSKEQLAKLSNSSKLNIY